MLGAWDIPVLKLEVDRCRFLGRCRFRFYFSIILKVNVGFGFLKYRDIGVDFDFFNCFYSSLFERLCIGGFGGPPAPNTLHSLINSLHSTETRSSQTHFILLQVKKSGVT